MPGKGLPGGIFFHDLNVFLNDFFWNLSGPTLFRGNPQDDPSGAAPARRPGQGSRNMSEFEDEQVPPAAPA